jgi:hypothetical protein
VALYSTGWRFDLKTLKLQKVGGIFIRSYPANAEIYLHGKPIKNDSGLFQSGTLIKNLFPATYQLKLSLDNFETWQENISVYPSVATEVKAVLIPRYFTQVATGTIQNFWLFNGEIVVKDKNGLLLTLGGKKIGRGDILEWTGDASYVLTLNQDTGIYSWNDAASGVGININSALKKVGLVIKPGTSISVDPSDKRRLIVYTQTKIYLFDTEKLSLTDIYKTDAGATLGRMIVSSQFYLAWMEFNAAQNTSTLVIYDKFLRKPLGNAAEFKGANKKIKWTADKKIAVLQNDGRLYLYDSSGNVLNKLADDVKDFSLADDDSAVAVLENSSLEIIPLNQNQNYRRFNLPERETIKNTQWYADNNHIFISYPDRVSFLDLNDGGLSNFPTIAQGTTSAYDSDANRFYILKNDGLFSLDFVR